MTPAPFTIKFTYLILLLLPLQLLAPTILLGQVQSKQADSLYELAQTATGSKKIQLYLELATTLRHNNSDTAGHFAHLAAELAEKSGSAHDKMMSYYTLGRISAVKGNSTL